MNKIQRWTEIKGPQYNIISKIIKEWSPSNEVVFKKNINYKACQYDVVPETN